ncbi:MAG: hypothetical protein KAS38_06635, partial [Anaerolineales bacterium]|nr:hypothetical protein [Anaerolineales bacterium]
TVGMRFTNIQVPQGAQISSAYIQFKVDEISTGGTTLQIQGQAIDNAVTFTRTTSDISSREKTSAGVAWSPPPWTLVGETGVDQRTGDISSIVQEIVNRQGWTSGNSLVLIITGNGTRWAESYNGDAAGAPMLHIEFDPGG